jgi:hypothetical protein
MHGFTRTALLASSLVVTTGIFVLAPSALADSGAHHRVRNTHFGVSGGNVNDVSRAFCCSGTLGSLVKSSDGTQYILSNNHVLDISGTGHVGDHISQPGLIDNSCRVATVVADLTGAAPLGSNVDAAIAQLRTGLMDSTGYIEDIGVPSSHVRAAAVGLGVAKSGRTTGFTTGTISSTNTSVSVRYQPVCGRGGGTAVTYTNQVVINSSTFSAGGDSGSLIVTNNSCHQPVALLFAGSSTTTIGNPVGEVLTKLGTATGLALTFVGTTCTAKTEEEPGVLRDDVIQATAAVLDLHRDDLMATTGVIGVGVGASRTAPGEGAIVIYVDSTAGVLPRLPRRIDGVRVRVVKTDPFVLR